MTTNNSTILQSFKEARNQPLFEKLFLLGIKPVRDNANIAWYLSPLRNESTASFKLDKTINKWYDHGAGIGGNTLDFYMHYFQCSAKVALEKLNDSKSFFVQPHDYPFKSAPKSKVKLLSAERIKNKNLIQYLNYRGFDLIDFENILFEVWYQINDKKFYSIGFKNIYDGYELRNEFLKSSIGKKGISVIENGSKLALVFEGFLNFFSYQKLFGKIQNSVVVLNSVANQNEAISYLNEYVEIHLFLDNDKAGNEATNSLMGAFVNAKDKRDLYSEHNDLNDYLMYKIKTL